MEVFWHGDQAQVCVSKACTAREKVMDTCLGSETENDAVEKNIK